LKIQSLRIFRLAGGGACALAFAMPALAVDEAYLATVRAEVAEFSTKSFAVKESPWVPATKAPEEGAELKGSLAEFEAFLQVEAPGTYIFFKRLPDWNKSRLQEEYKKTGDLEKLKASVYNARGQ